MLPATEEGQGVAPRFAYLLLSHMQPGQVEALSHRICVLSAAGQVVVHHDLTGEGLPWNGAPPERVHLVERSAVRWGDWSIVEATLRMIEFAIDELDAAWIVLISGEHWPIADLDEWERSTLAGDADAFVDARALPRRLRFGHAEDRPNRFLARCVHRWGAFAQPRSALLRRGLAGLAKVSGYVQPLTAVDFSHRRSEWLLARPRRRGPLRGWTFYKGTQWIACNRRAADGVIRAGPEVTAWFRRSHIPDESYLQTLLHQDPSVTVRGQTVTYVPAGPRYPGMTRWMLLNHEDLPAAFASGAAFARKVDPVNRPSVLRAIDDRVDAVRQGMDDAGSRAVDDHARRAHAEGDVCVVVAGMHRSGTSATAGLLVGHGVAGPPPEDLVPPSSSNERGHWESRTVVNCNTRLLAAVGATAYAPPADLPDWLEPQFDDLRVEAQQWFSAYSNGRPLVLKDPRCCLTLPFWRTAIPARMGAVLVVRDPIEVARSLHARDHIPVLLGLAMWDRYVRTVVPALAGLPTLVLEYAAMLGDPDAASETVATFLQRLGVNVELTSDAAASGLDATLRHQRASDTDYADVAQPQQALYRLLVSRAGYHESWQPPEPAPAPPWVEDTLAMRRELSSARRELHWVQASRAYRLAGALWRRTGERPTGLPGASGGGLDRTA